MVKIVQIRGTSGSGKTHTAYEVMKRLGHYGVAVTEVKGITDIGWQALGFNTVLIGKYDTACGGCDTIKTQDEICRRVILNVNEGRNVVFEGLLISQIYERYAKLHNALVAQGHQYAFAYLDTPVEKCVAQVNSRRQAAHAVKLEKALNRNAAPDKLPRLTQLNETNTRSKHRDCLRNRDKDLANGFTVIDLRHDDDPAGQVIDFLSGR
jgi:predicted kinase